MLESLARHCPAYRCYVLCLDDFTHQWLTQRAHPCVVVVPLSALEAADAALDSCQHNRSRVEYFFTFSPCFPLYLLERFDMDFICSLDADMVFYQDPTPLFAPFSDYSILITEHHHSDPQCQVDLKTGIFNVSFQAFRRNATGLACLRRWREQCIDWCYHYCDEQHGRYADQKYLDSWPTDYAGEVLILRPRVAALATWNVNHYDLTYREGVLYSDGAPLVFYHFHGLRFLHSRWISNQFFWHNTRCTSVLRQHIYLPYIATLSGMDKELRTEGAALAAFPSWRVSLVNIVKARTVFFWVSAGTFVYLDFSFLHRLWKMKAWVMDFRSKYAKLLRFGLPT